VLQSGKQEEGIKGSSKKTGWDRLFSANPKID
jgi:hypothetical protein